MKSKVFGFLVLLIAFSSCVKKATEGVEVVNVTTFEQKMKEPTAQLLDVRTSGEFAEGHIPNSVNIDVTGADFEQKVAGLDKAQPVLVYCKMGGRSAKAAEKLKALGFTTIVDLDGGFSSWSGEGKPVE
jgi:rhodanese-related sulfurtransferase